jgi:asparagine synthase (glutamine-hydrolysing)
MATSDGRMHLTFNGEIFNYRQVRNRLNYPFRTAGDTEVLLATLAIHGADGLNQLRGQFACAAYDSRRDEIILVRDRVGILPLYYVSTDKLFAFASEIKALVPVLDGPPLLDSGQLASYLTRRAVPAPNTLVKGIRKVPPGHILRVNAGGEISLRSYWQLPSPSDVLVQSRVEVVRSVDTALDLAVNEALTADVPVGAYLSGGLDSSLVVALASRHVAPRKLYTLCAEFGDPRYDESDYASIVSSRFSTDHHTVAVRAEDFLSLWEKLTYFRDAPLSEPADIAVFRLAQEARHHVKVMLSGEGGDELFGGYPKYRMARATGWAGLIPARARRSLLVPLERALPARANRARIALRAQTGVSIADRVATWFSPFTAYECQDLLGLEMPPLTHIPYRDAVDLMSRQDMRSWLPDNLLERGDRMSMAASLELRPPFLDARLIELAARLPSRFKVHNGEAKWILREVGRGYLPSTVIDRRKVGFRVPLDAWFRAGLRPMMRDLLLSSDAVVQDVMDGAVVKRLITDHERGRRNEEIRIWTLLSFEVWARCYLRQSASVADDCWSRPDAVRQIAT